jgi:hypothetical protein
MVRFYMSPYYKRGRALSLTPHVLKTKPPSSSRGSKRSPGISRSVLTATSSSSVSNGAVPWAWSKGVTLHRRRGARKQLTRLEDFPPRRATAISGHCGQIGASLGEASGSPCRVLEYQSA